MCWRVFTHRSTAIFILLLCALLFISSGSVDSHHSVTAVSSGLKIKQRNPVVNENSQIRLTAIDLNGQPLTDVRWESGSSDIATVNAQSGEVTGLQQGFATITARRGSEAVSVFVVVARVKKGKGTQVPGDTKLDSQGSLYISNPSQAVIYKADKALSSDLKLFAGKLKTPGFRDGQVSDALFAGPTAIAVNNDVQGGLYITDTLNHSIRKIDFNHRVETILGNGTPGVNSFEQSRLVDFNQLALRSPRGIAVAAGGNLFIADTDNHAIYYVDFAQRRVALLAGVPGEIGNADGDGANARFKRPSGLALNPEGNILAVADEDNNRVRVLELTTQSDGRITTLVTTLGVAGTRQSNQSINSTINNELEQQSAGFIFDAPQSLSFDSVGNIYVVDQAGVQVVTQPFSAQPELINLAQPEISFNQATSVVVRGREVYVLDAQEQQVGNELKVVTVGEPVLKSISPEIIATNQDSEIVITGQNFAPESVVTFGDSQIAQVQVVSATEIRVRVPNNIRPGARNLSILTRGGIAQRVVSVIAKPVQELAIGEITTIAGGVTFFGDGGLGANSSLMSPTKLALDASGNLFVADVKAQRVRRLDAATSIVTTIVGGGNSLQDGINATIAQITPTCLAIDSDGNLFVGDAFTASVRRVDALTRNIRTVAGGAQGPKAPFSGDGDLAIKANLGDLPQDIAIDSAGNLYIAANNRVRRVDAGTGIITTFAGNGQLDFSGDGGPAINAAIAKILGIALDGNDNLFIVMPGRVRRVDAVSGIITTVVGDGGINLDFENRDGRLATNVSIFTDSSSDLAIDAAGNIYLAEDFFGKLLRVDAQTRLISTVRPQPLPIENVCADLLFNGGVVLDGANRIFISEITGRVRQVDLTTRVSTRLLGGNKINLRGDNNGDGESASRASLGKPQQIVSDRRGNIYMADTANGLIRKIDAQTGLISTVAGNGQRICDERTNNPVGKRATEAAIMPFYLAIDRSDNLYFSNTRQIYRIDAGSNIIGLAAGILTGLNNGEDAFTGDGGPATQAALGQVTGLALNDNGDLFISAIRFFSDGRVRRVDASTGIITTIAGNGQSFSGDGGPALLAGMLPLDIAFDHQGNLLLVDTGLEIGYRIRQIDAATGIINTIAGNGTFFFSGENGPAVQAGLGFVQSVTTDPDGNIFIGAVEFAIGDVKPGPPRAKPRVWRVDAQTKLIGVVIDSPQGVFSGDGGPSSSASLIGFRDDGRVDVELDRAGNLLILSRDDASVAALRLIKLLPTNNTNSRVEIKGFNFIRPMLTIDGRGFGDTAARVEINGEDVSEMITTQIDNRLILTGKRKQLNLKKRFNVVTVTNAQGERDSFSLGF